MSMSEITMNPFNEVLGPFYVESSLRRNGIEHTDDLISLSTSDGEIVFPRAQFDVQISDTLVRREKVIELWNNLIRPAINDGIIDEWTATGLLLQGTEDRPSEADVISKDDTQTERVVIQISRAISRFSQ